MKTQESQQLPKEKKDGLVKQRAEFEQISKQPATRIVTLSYKSCCGCGCEYMDIMREVPFDSPLKDGDMTRDFLKGDTYKED